MSRLETDLATIVAVAKTPTTRTTSTIHPAALAITAVKNVPATSPRATNLKATSPTPDARATMTVANSVTQGRVTTGIAGTVGDTVMTGATIATTTCSPVHADETIEIVIERTIGMVTVAEATAERSASLASPSGRGRL